MSTTEKKPEQKKKSVSQPKEANTIKLKFVIKEITFEVEGDAYNITRILTGTGLNF